MGLQSVRCARCAVLNPADSATCAECGQPLAPTAASKVRWVLPGVVGLVVALLAAANWATQLPSPLIGNHPAGRAAPAGTQKQRGRGVTDPPRSDRIQAALARAAEGPAIEQAVLVLPLTDDAGAVTSAGSMVALLAMYQSSYLPHRKLDANFPESVYRFQQAGAFSPGKPLAGEMETRIRRTLPRPVIARGMLKQEAGAWRARLSFDDAPDRKPIWFGEYDLEKLPGIMAHEIQKHRKATLTGDEHIRQLTPEVSTQAALLELAALSGGAVPAACALPTERGAFLERLSRLHAQEPKSSLITSMWLEALSECKDPRLQPELDAVAQHADHDQLKYMVARLKAGDDAARAERLLERLGVEYPRGTYQETLQALFKRLDRWADADEVLKFWTGRQPACARAHAARGRFLKDFAWRARGTGWAASVSGDGWRLFGERLAEARRELELAWTLKPEDPTVPLTMLWIGIGSTAGREFIEQWFARGTALEPDSLPLHQAKLNYLMEKWYGSREEMMRFARETAAHAAGGRRALVLALAHDELACRSLPPGQGHTHARYFQDPAVAREVRAVLDQVLASHPDDATALEWAALVAWATGDRAAAAAALRKQGPRLAAAGQLQGWPSFPQLSAWALTDTTASAGTRTATR